MFFTSTFNKALLAVFILIFTATALAKKHPNLVMSYQDTQAMRMALKGDNSFSDTFAKTKAKVDVQISKAINVPAPKDSGGGFTHERHKKNYQLMYNAGVVYQLTQQKKYAEYVRDMLFAYADMYPSLPLHPARRQDKNNPGKLFWQSLNEAVWLVYTSQAYDMIISHLTEHDKTRIETGILRPIVKFLSVDSPATFNKVHNHGTWLTAAVGMTGYVIGEQEWVEQALYGLDKSGKGGFMRQLEELFSPQGYYNEGPYYQRYALMPFVTFAKAIETNEPERKIFEYRDGVLLKAINTTIDLSYNGLFFPLNDAIKSKGIDTIELVQAVTIAYGLTKNSGLLDIASQQQQIILTGDGLQVAKALDAGLATPYAFTSKAFGDGADGKQGALVVMRQHTQGDQALVFKPAAQGLGHGHFDKLAWLFYDKGEEIVADYGAARFLNVEAKYGGQYLPENDSYAKQTIAHNTLVVDEKSHFDGDVSVGNNNHPIVDYYATNTHGTLSKAHINTAYSGVELTRMMALITLPKTDISLAVDVFHVASDKAHQYDLPVHYQGQLIDTNFERNAYTEQLSALGNAHGYQHLWLTATGVANEGISKVTWLNENGRFYTQSAIVDGDTETLFTRIGANDPLFNLRNEAAFIYRKKASKQHTFVSVLEPHGEYNPSKEFTLEAQSKVTALHFKHENNISLLEITLANASQYLLAVNEVGTDKTEFTYNNNDYQLDGRFTLLNITKQQ
ncbi:heparinase II/III family protein [Thalassotalea sp. 1_MG-2023]|uniref:heparinase II/III domain-containing protein n=1 Tax=Thalassotalea sp. 1_MG-2023 TaxID=3062680 RepID=UPI0026E33AD8|nr:heparinase II/III family protein [Thalassotalea sp. 1_MG-2023]MDO6427587.1 heparinase II/III family protein [Thalassotalea sp. 1_MG-2023]